MTYSLIWLADVLRTAGCKVVEAPGWKTRGRAEMATPEGVLLHHTGPGSSAALLALVRDGRGGPTPLPGPLSHLFLDDDGTYHVIAAGRCNHAGAGIWHGVTAGNAHLIGIEAKNAGDGKDIWEAEQMTAYTVGVAALLKKIEADAVMAAGHREYATPRGRKIDPTFDMVTFREGVEAVMAGGIAAVPALPATVDPKRSMLRKGDQGASVRELQARLGLTVDGAFGPKTEAVVKTFQTKHGLTADGLVGPKTWEALL